MSARTCSNCGAPASSWAQFCRECGQDLAVVLPLSDEQVVPAPEVRVPWPAWEGLIIFLAVLVATILPTLVIAKGIDCRLESLPAAEAAACDTNNLATLAVNELALLGFTLGWIRWRHGASPRALGLRRPDRSSVLSGVGTAVLGLLIAYGASVIISTLYRVITGNSIEEPQQIDLHAARPSALMLAILGFVVVVVAPIAEEVFFRGFLFRSFQRWATPMVAMSLSAVAFGLVHLIPLVIISTFLLGLLLASVVERKGSLTPAIVAHVLFNAVGFVLLLATSNY